ncbi:MAG TPA: ECF transporter S component [Clostridiales bacterium]|nr:ECF transporter S component [Clostridiales bacterium]
MKKQNMKLVLSALFIALGIILPFITMQIPRIGNMLLPMHIPVMLCGFICGGPYGFIVGLIVPLLRSVLVGMPLMMPTAVSMSPELAVYGLVTGYVYQKLKDRRFGIYVALLTAMILGRIVWGGVSIGLFSLMGNSFTWKLFVMNGFVNAIPGIVIQLIFIPLLVKRLKRNKEVGAFL